MRKKIHLVAAARPNFMKVAPLYHCLREQDWCVPILVHTGQHYDPLMSDVFLNDLMLPPPDHHLAVGSGSHAEQTAGVMVTYEALCQSHSPDWVVVVGDVNSTMAAAIAAKKCLVPVAHLEAGLRSRDHTMPEEINRIITDSIVDLLWTPSVDADENLRQEGHADGKIVFVGNIMIDAYEMLRSKIESVDMLDKWNLQPGGFGVVTLHRPSNVDDPAVLTEIVNILKDVAGDIPLVFPLHPRTKARLEDAGLIRDLADCPGLHMIEPLGYVAFMSLVSRSALAITDSGGIQEETTYLGIPCLTLRDTTERPVTVNLGTNRLVTRTNLTEQVRKVLDGKWPTGSVPDLWDGRTATRVAESLREFMSA